MEGIYKFKPITFRQLSKRMQILLMELQGSNQQLINAGQMTLF